MFSFPGLLACGLAVVTFLTMSTRFDDPDLWWQLRMGQVIWTTRAIPSTDIFSYTTHGHAWTAHEWLAQLSIFGAYRAGGYSGLQLWVAVLASLIFIVVFGLCRLRSGSLLGSFMGGLVAWFFGTAGLAIRPLIVGHLFLALELLFLELARRRGRRWLWFLPPLFAVWVNCHGSYFFGMGVLAVWWISSLVSGSWGLITAEKLHPQLRRDLGLVLGLCALALCLNPVGIRLLLYPLDTLFLQSISMQAVNEWMAPGLREPRTLGMLAVTAAIALLVMLRRAELELRDLLLLAVAFALATQHARMIFIFGIIAAPVLCVLAAPLLGKEARQDHPVANAILMAGCAAAIFWTFPSSAEFQRQIAKMSPVGAVEYIRKAGLRGPMLNDYAFGGYLIWALPEEKVFIDGRADVFDWTGVFAEYGRWVTVSEDPALLLNKYQIRFCLLAAGTPSVQVMAYLPGWRRVYADAVAVVYAR